MPKKTSRECTDCGAHTLTEPKGVFTGTLDEATTMLIAKAKIALEGATVTVESPALAKPIVITLRFPVAP